MSGAHVRLAERVRGLDPSEALVLREIASRQLDATGWARKRLELLAEACGMSRRNLIYVIADLERMGLLVVKRRKGCIPLYRLADPLPLQVRPTGRRGLRIHDARLLAGGDQGSFLLPVDNISPLHPLSERKTEGNQEHVGQVEGSGFALHHPHCTGAAHCTGGCSPLHWGVQPIAPPPNNQLKTNLTKRGRARDDAEFEPAGEAGARIRRAVEQLRAARAARGGGGGGGGSVEPGGAQREVEAGASAAARRQAFALLADPAGSEGRGDAAAGGGAGEGGSGARRLLPEAEAFLAKHRRR